MQQCIFIRYSYLSGETMKLFTMCMSSVLKHIDKTNRMMGSGDFVPITGSLHAHEMLKMLQTISYMSKENDINCQVRCLVEDLESNVSLNRKSNAKMFDEEESVSPSTVDNCVQCLLEILPFWKLGLTDGNTCDKQTVCTLLIMLKWAFRHVKDDHRCEVLRKILLWIKSIVHNNKLLREELLMETEEVKSCVLDLLSIYDYLCSVVLSFEIDSSMATLNELNTLKRCLNDIFLPLLDLAMNPDYQMTNSCQLSDTLNGVTFTSPLQSIRTLGAAGNEFIMCEVSSLLVREAWFGDQLHLETAIKLSKSN